MNKCFVILLMLILSMAFIIVGCGSDSTSPEENLESFTITSAGGTFTTADTVITLIIPADAVDSDTTITIGVESNHPDDPGLVSSTCYQFGPDDMIFSLPVTLIIRYDINNVPDGVDEATLGIHKAVENSWQPIIPYAVIEDSSFVTCQISGFSSYGIVGHSGTIYNGDVTIDSTGDIGTYSQYTGITGDLTINPNYMLTDLTGLNNLEWIGGSLLIDYSEGNSSLDFGDGLSELKTVNGDFSIYDDFMPVIEFPSLEVVGGDFDIRGDSVQSFVFPNFVSIGGIFKAQYLSSLINFSGLNGIASAGAVDIYSCSGLYSLTGLEGIGGVVDYVNVGACGNLTSLNGLEGITTVVGELEINNNDALLTLDGLNVVRVGGLDIVYNDTLTTLEHLEHLAVVGDEGISIQYNTRLSSLQGLNGLGIVEGGISLWYNPELQTLNGLAHITSCKYLYIEDCHALHDISALSSLYYVHGNVRLLQNHALTDLDDLSGLTYMGGSLDIHNNWYLENIDGLSHLSEIGLELGYGHLWIRGNTRLTDITGLHNLDISATTGYAINGLAQITDNSMGDAAAWAFITAIGGEDAVRDAVTISGN